jgi:predicted RNase H-like HicB family nuclease
MIKLTVILTPNTQGFMHGFVARCPAFPGCTGGGMTEDEAAGELQRAIEEYAEVVGRGAFVRGDESAFDYELQWGQPVRWQ